MKAMLIEKYYEHPEFKHSPSRKWRKMVSSLDGKEFEAKPNSPTGYFRIQFDCESISVPRSILRNVPRNRKHKYTPEQIAKAKMISYELLKENTMPMKYTFGKSFMAVCFHTFTNIDNQYVDSDDEKNIGKKRVVAILGNALSGCERNRSIAFCSPHDEFNQDIGIMVALCKLFDKALPDWI